MPSPTQERVDAIRATLVEAFGWDAVRIEVAPFDAGMKIGAAIEWPGEVRHGLSCLFDAGTPERLARVIRGRFMVWRARHPSPHEEVQHAQQEPSAGAVDGRSGA